MSSSLSVTGYEELKTTLNNVDKDKRIFLLFSGTKDDKGHSW